MGIFPTTCNVTDDSMAKQVTEYTVELRFNEVPRDWGNWFVISRVRYIEVLFHALVITRLKNIVRYTEDFVI